MFVSNKFVCFVFICFVLNAKESVKFWGRIVMFSYWHLFFDQTEKEREFRLIFRLKELGYLTLDLKCTSLCVWRTKLCNTYYLWTLHPVTRLQISVTHIVLYQWYNYSYRSVRHILYQLNRALSFRPTCFRPIFFVQSISSSPIRFIFLQFYLQLHVYTWSCK